MDIAKSVGFTDVGLYSISESVRAYAYLILTLRASARSSIIANTASALTVQSAFLNNFENVVNCRVNIQEDIKRYQDTLSYASSKVDYRVGENIYMLPSNMNLKIRSGTVGHNNKILVSDEKFSLGKNDMVNVPPSIGAQAPGPAVKSHAQTADSNDVLAHAPTITHKNQEPLQTAGRGTSTRGLPGVSQQGKNCFGTGSGKWFCNMEYVLMKVSLYFNKKGLPDKMFLYGSPAEVNKLHS